MVRPAAWTTGRSGPLPFSWRRQGTAAWAENSKAVAKGFLLHCPGHRAAGVTVSDRRGSSRAALPALRHGAGGSRAGTQVWESAGGEKKAKIGNFGEMEAWSSYLQGTQVVSLWTSTVSPKLYICVYIQRRFCYRVFLAVCMAKN